MTRIAVAEEPSAAAAHEWQQAQRCRQALDTFLGCPTQAAFERLGQIASEFPAAFLLARGYAKGVSGSEG